MKKTLGIIVLFLTIGTYAKAQTEVLFKLKVNPDHRYVSTLKMDMDMQMKMATTASAKPTGKTTKTVAKTANKSKAGVKAGAASTAAKPQNMLMTMGYLVTGDMNTGTEKGDKLPFSMVLKMDMGNIMMNGKATPTGSTIPKINETLYGSYDQEGVITIDSVSGKKESDLLKPSMAKMVKAFQSGLKFPDKPLKVGDTFVQTMPLEMPMAGIQAKLNSNVTYKLTAIKDNKAYFDIVYVISTDANTGQMTMNLTGGGDGKIVYDMLENYPVDTQSTIGITYKMSSTQLNSMNMDGKMKLAMNVKTDITKN